MPDQGLLPLWHRRLQLGHERLFSSKQLQMLSEIRRSAKDETRYFEKLDWNPFANLPRLRSPAGCQHARLILLLQFRVRLIENPQAYQFVSRSAIALCWQALTSSERFLSSHWSGCAVADCCPVSRDRHGNDIRAHHISAREYWLLKPQIEIPCRDLILRRVRPCRAWV